MPEAHPGTHMTTALELPATARAVAEHRRRAWRWVGIGISAVVVGLAVGPGADEVGIGWLSALAVFCVGGGPIAAAVGVAALVNSRRMQRVSGRGQMPTRSARSASRWTTCSRSSPSRRMRPPMVAGSPSAGPTPGAGGVVHSYEEALNALDLADRLDLGEPVLRSGDLLVYPVLTRDRQAMADLVLSALGPLQTARGGAQPLLDTLTAYFDAGCVAAEAARRLRLSVRALTYRLSGSTSSPAPTRPIPSTATPFRPPSSAPGCSVGRTRRCDTAPRDVADSSTYGRAHRGPPMTVRGRAVRRSAPPLQQWLR
jgi:hypothetical protein